MMRIGKRSAFFVFPLLLSGANSSAVDSPEIEIVRARSDLRQVGIELAAIAQLGRQQPAGPQLDLLEKIYQSGKQQFSANEHHSAITTLRKYLVGGTATVNEKYLSAQYMLGRSYEYLSLKSQAMRTYRRYLASSLTSENINSPDMMDVLSRLLPLAASVHSGRRGELRTFFSSVAHMAVPEKLAAESIAALGKAAAMTGNANVAKKWLSLADQKTDSPRVRALTIYYRALLHLAEGKDDEASLLLGNLIQLKSPEARVYVESGQLAMARLAMLRGDAQLAYEFLKGDLPPGPIQKEMIYEKIFTSMKIGKLEIGFKTAQLFLEKYPNDPNAYKVKAVSALLLANQGKMGAAQNQLEQAEKKLIDLYEWLRKFSGDGALRRADAYLLHDTLEGYADHPSDLVDALAIYDRMATLKARLAIMGTDLSKSVVMLGDLRLWQVYPYWNERAKQLDVVIRNVLKIGHRLVASERYALSALLNKADAYTLEANEQSRINLFTPTEKYSREVASWGEWLNIYGTEIKRRRLATKISDLQNKLKAFELEARQESGNASSNRSLKLSELRIKQLTKQFSGITESLNLRLIKSYQSQSPHVPIQRFIAAYGNLIFEDSQILATYLKKSKDPGIAIMTEEWGEIWSRWESMTKAVYKELSYLGQDISNQSEELLSNIEGNMKSQKRLERDLNSLSDKLQNAMAENLSDLISHYDTHVNSRLAKLRKWGADIEWLRYEETKEKTTASKEDFLLKQRQIENPTSEKGAVIR